MHIWNDDVMLFCSFLLLFIEFIETNRLMMISAISVVFTARCKMMQCGARFPFMLFHAYAYTGPCRGTYLLADYFDLPIYLWDFDFCRFGLLCAHSALSLSHFKRQKICTKIKYQLKTEKSPGKFYAIVVMSAKHHVTILPSASSLTCPMLYIFYWAHLTAAMAALM